MISMRHKYTYVTLSHGRFYLRQHPMHDSPECCLSVGNERYNAKTACDDEQRERHRPGGMKNRHPAIIVKSLTTTLGIYPMFIRAARRECRWQHKLQKTKLRQHRLRTVECEQILKF